nr:MAG TPA: hypothetical protein [Caudoviricetes sp.]
MSSYCNLYIYIFTNINISYLFTFVNSFLSLFIYICK